MTPLALQPIDISIDREEVLRYLGHRPGQSVERSLPLLERAEELLRTVMTPRYTARAYPFSRRQDGVLVEEAGLLLSGMDIVAHLSKSTETCILMAATLGSGVERLISYWEKMDMALSLALDATATTAIEAVCDALEEQLRGQYRAKELDLTFRYSPGYGDLPIAVQNNFLTALDAPRAIGLTANRSHLLLPRKSVTAVLGVTSKGTLRSAKGCAACANYESCSFRKEGMTCGHS